MRHQIAMKEGIGATGHITQRNRLAHVSITIDVPLLILVENGRKHVRSDGADLWVEAGEAIAIDAGVSVTIENIPASDGSYEARWLSLEPEIIRTFDAAPSAAAMGMVRALGPMNRHVGHAFHEAVAALADRDGDLPEAVIRHRVTELLVWLSEAGIHFSASQAQTVSARVRRLIMKRPSDPWHGAGISSALGVSEATLRRRLQQEGTSLRAILTDVRMTQAMQLLQSSSMPVSEIAASTGFQSQSRFAIRFRHRFGFAPTALRGRPSRKPPEEAPAYEPSRHSA